MSRSAYVKKDSLVANEEFSVHNLNTGYGGSNGGGGDMTDRLDRLEKKVDSMESALSRLNESITRMDSKVELQSVKFTGAIELQSNKLASSLDLQAQKLSSALELQAQKLTDAIERQSIIFDGKLKDQKLSIILWILGLPSLVFAIYKLYDMFKPT
ncbi:hypothetical protein [Serratia fonticola]|uniref:hypothetical protein n=1 Tax=Serratia fonticola TaxID=47917 RepID=UPI001AEB0908|nr:hypothetical protein [Serratia fonticola]MBP0998870.1 hypothetical protein [Serratia fonticola]